MGGFISFRRSVNFFLVSSGIALFASAGLTSCNLFLATAYPGVTSQVTPPAMTPTAGTYSSDQAITLSCATTGSIIHYTTDGTEPTPASPTYSSPITVAGNTTTMKIQAIGLRSGWKDSPVATASYLINYQQVSTPQFTPSGGQIGHTTTIAIFF